MRTHLTMKRTVVTRKGLLLSHVPPTNVLPEFRWGWLHASLNAGPYCTRCLPFLGLGVSSESHQVVGPRGDDEALMVGVLDGGGGDSQIKRDRLVEVSELHDARSGVPVLGASRLLRHQHVLGGWRPSGHPRKSNLHGCFCGSVQPILSALRLSMKTNEV